MEKRTDKRTDKRIDKRTDKKTDKRTVKQIVKKTDKKIEKPFDKKPEKEFEAPSKEAKALSLFLMAFKSKEPAYLEKSKRINKLWRMVTRNQLNTKDYMKEVNNVIATYGGYNEIVEKTVKFYISKTGKWDLKGEDKYCKDAKRFADKLLKK